MKKTFTGWIGKTSNIKDFLARGFNDSFEIDDMYATKGNKYDWGDDDWPPIKVKVTVETVEK